MSLTPQEIPTGAVRYNTDSNKMEVYIGSTWMEVSVSTPNLDGGSRGLFTLHTQTIDFLTIPTAGNSQDFGDLSSARNNAVSLSSRTRACFGSGYVPSPAASTNIIDFVTIASTGGGGGTPAGSNTQIQYNNEASSQRYKLYVETCLIDKLEKCQDHQGNLNQNEEAYISKE